MQPAAKLMKLTFNAPAARLFDLPVHGLQIRIEADRMFLRPSDTATGIDVVAVTPRKRGGYTVEIDYHGTLATQLLHCLQRAGLTATEPFFVIQAASDGFTVAHYPSAEAPQKHMAYMRVWRVANPTTNATLRPPMFDFNVWRTARRMALRAGQVLAEHGRSRGVGRPPVVVQEAKQIIASLSRLNAEIAVQSQRGPQLSDSEDGWPEDCMQNDAVIEMNSRYKQLLIRIIGLNVACRIKHYDATVVEECVAALNSLLGHVATLAQEAQTILTELEHAHAERHVLAPQRIADNL